MGSLQMRRTAADLSAGLLDLRAEFAQRFQMQIDRSFAELAAARCGKPHLAAARKDRSKIHH